AYTSAHYLVRALDGQVTQLVRTSDVAWFAGTAELNEQSVGIALDSVGSGALPHYSEATYASVAALVRYVAGMYRIPLDRQHVHFVPLHVAPSDTAPLLSDPLAHPDGGPGSTDLADFGDKAVTGQVFAVAERRAGWTAIWYGGQRGWFRDAPGTTRQVRAQ